MNYLVIDSDDYWAAGVEAFFFPGGEPHAKIPDFTGKRLLLNLKLRTWVDAGRAIAVVDAIYQQSLASRLEAALFVPYFPGARQDRSDGRSPLTAEIYGALFGYGDFPLHTFDVHSKYMAPYIERNWMPADLDLSALRGKYSGVIAPDAGAYERALSFAQAIDVPFVIQAEKKRDFATGRITGYEVDVPSEGTYLVVDDICDGGATFNLLANATPDSAQLDLWVSHGIFSRGVGALSARYQRILTTDSRVRWTDIVFYEARVTTYGLGQLFNRIMEC